MLAPKNGGGRYSGVVEDDAYDLSPLYAYIEYGGESFVRLCDRKVLSSPEDEEIGMLFEIGRIMLECGVSYDALRCSSDEIGYKKNSGDWTFFYKI